MKRWMKRLVWIFGLILLIYLIRYPLQPLNSMWKTWSLPLTGKKIVLDAGHGGPDGGAEGRDGTKEKDITLQVVKQLRDYLQQAGALVYLTRETDEDLADSNLKGLSRRKSQDIRRRLAMIHDKNADFFLTIHLNAMPSGKWRGAQTFYYPKYEESGHLAKMIQEEIIQNLQNTNRQVLTINSVYLLKEAEIPGALVEIGFLSNEDERELLKQEEYQLQMANSIYEGILRFVTEEVEEED
ncbi:MAG TPA: N-acetylmuramoyl-L-alanine amidase CwlD [Cerasibacillus sp.]|uniref:N-acetylmuramoyl-L-alanine amidase CwlD n=1 Tax=Cerasibacillus sp. TaxID=2498711 RepID=UPI002F3F21F7